MSELLSRVLVVDDDPDAIFLLGYLFRKAGIRRSLLPALNGERAIESLSRCLAERSSLPAFVLADLKMPRVSGIDLTRWIRAQPALKELPVILLSSSPEPTDIAGAYGAGVDAYLIKYPEASVFTALCSEVDAGVDGSVLLRPRLRTRLPGVMT